MWSGTSTTLNQQNTMNTFNVTIMIISTHRIILDATNPVTTGTPCCKTVLKLGSQFVTACNWRTLQAIKTCKLLDGDCS